MPHHRPLLALSLLAIFACRTTAPATAPAPVDPDADPWALLETGGDTEGALAIFDAWAGGPRALESRVGRMVVAMTRTDADTLRRLLEGLDLDALPEDRTLVYAAQAALTLRPVPDVAVALGQRACALAQRTSDEPLAVAARSPCVMATLVTAAGPDLDACKTGCDSTQTLALEFAGTAPVAMVSVGGAAPAPFIVDTGASKTLLTRAFAQAHGIEVVPGTEHKVHSPGGLLEAGLAVIDVAMGGLYVERVPALVLDLPIDFVAGIVSPQNTWRPLAVTFDFRAFTLTTAPAAGPDPELVALPLTLAEDNPYLRVATPDRPVAPILLDTGAQHTVLFTRWDALGPPLERVGEARVAGAGGKGAAAFTTKARVPAEAGPLTWTIEHPTLADRPDEAFHHEVRHYGLVGMDFMLGRRVVLDMPERTLRISKDARLAEWAVGEAVTYVVRAKGWPAPVKVAERVVARDDDAVTLEAAYEGPAGPVRFRYRIRDTWGSRGTWLISRPAEAMWDVAADGALTEVPAEQRVQRWLPVFVGFKAVASDKNPEIAFEPQQRGDRKVSCTRVALPAAAKDAPEATLELVECPQDNWRTRRLTVKSATGEVIYEFAVE